MHILLEVKFLKNIIVKITRDKNKNCCLDLVKFISVFTTTSKTKT